MRAGIFAVLFLMAFGVQGSNEHRKINHQGFYIGILGGAGKFNGKPDYGSTFSFNKMGGDVNAYGGYFGYRTYKGQLSIAFEAEYLALNGKTQIEIPSLSFNMENRLKNTWAASVLFGYMLADNVEFNIRGGYGKTNTSAEMKDSTNDLDGKSSYRNYIAGLGFRVINQSPIGLRFEYRHYFNKDYKAYDESNAVDIKSDTDLFLVALEYTF